VVINPATADSLALAVALALRAETLRNQLLQDFRDSPFQNHAIDLRSYLNGKAGQPLAASVAEKLGKSAVDFRAFLAALPHLTIQFDRTFDRVKWKGTADVIVYASGDSGMKRLLAGPVARGYRTTGQSVDVPIWDAGLGTYLSIFPTDINFGNDPEGRRAASPKHTDRQTISTREEERAREQQHVATFNTMLPPPTCDPSPCQTGGGPSADGIALPYPYTAAYCFGWTSWGMEAINSTNDTDHDGIRQDCEYQLAYQFRPQMARNSHEDAPDREPYWSVTTVPGSLTRVRIFYALSYYRDAGAPYTDGYSSHDGDSEFVIVELENNMNPGNYRLWEVTYVTFSAHWNAGWLVDHTATYAASDLEYPVSYRGRPRVWESWDKHGNYRSKAVCNSEWNDACTDWFTGTVYDNLDVVAGANLGNTYNFFPDAGPSNQLLNCVTSRAPAFGQLGVECFWFGADVFAGWNPYWGQPAATRYRDMFYNYAF
jgi:hypothetical protein